MKRKKIADAVSEIRNVISDKHRKPILRILYELLDYGIRNKDFPKYYSKNMLHRKDVNNYLDYYIGKKEFYRIRYLVMKGERELLTILENKLLFHHHFKESNLKLPNYLGYNLCKLFFSPEGYRSVHNLDNFSRLIGDFIAKSNASSIFAKPIYGMGGKDCFKLNAGMLNPDCLTDVYDKISSSKYLFQETIVQHPLISAIYPHSVNTLRIHTCIHISGQIDLISIMMKFGSNGNYVEGGGKGTTLISVNMDTGELGPYAWKNFEWGGDRYIHHPDTGFKFAGFIVPHFEAAKEMVKSAAAFLPYRLVGWDVAITEKGPILIEGNHDFGFWGAQIADGGYKKNQAFRAFFEELTTG